MNPIAACYGWACWSNVCGFLVIGTPKSHRLMAYFQFNVMPCLTKLLSNKVSMPNSVTYPNRTPVFESYVLGVAPIGGGDYRTI